MDFKTKIQALLLGVKQYNLRSVSGFRRQKMCPVVSVSSQHCLPNVRASPVEFRDCMSSCFPDVWRHVRRSLFDGQHHYGDDYGDSDAGEDSQGAGSN